MFQENVRIILKSEFDWWFWSEDVVVLNDVFMWTIDDF